MGNRYYTEPLEDRFWAKVVIHDGCWEWTAATTDHGYGIIRDGKRNWKAHRLSAQIAGMSIDGKKVRHTCDNPPCCNPAHLLTGTQKDNCDDMTARGRRKGPPKRITDEQIEECRRRRDAGESQAALAREFGVSAATMSQRLNA